MNRFSIFIFLVFSLFLLAGCLQPGPAPGPSANPANSSAKGYVHEHAGFGIFINGEQVDLSDSVFMTEAASDLNTSCVKSGIVAHLHDNVGTIAHKHAANLTWGYFLSSIGIQWDYRCLTLYNGSRYCTKQASLDPNWSSCRNISGSITCSNSVLLDNSPELQFWVNDRIELDLANYPIHNLDKLVVAYGPWNDQTDRSSLSARIPDLAQNESTGEGCGSEALGEERPLDATRFHFNASAFSTAYFASATKLEHNESLTPSDFDSLYLAVQGAHPAVIYDLQVAQWLTLHGEGEHADHALSYAYQIAVKNVSVICLPHEAEHVGIYLDAGDIDMAGPAILRLQYDILPQFLKKMQEGAKVSKVYASANTAAAISDVRILSTAAANGDFKNPAVMKALDSLQTQPC